MYNLIRWYNQNRRKFWGIVVATFAIILLVWRLMYITTNRSLNQDAYTSQSQQVDTSNLNSITLTNDKSAITGKKASIDQNGIEIIDKFVSFCNSGSIQEAYNLLSNECKEQLYNELNDFQQAYYTPIFGNGRRNVNIENWNGDIFKVDYNEDALATGRYSVENSIQDYITIVNDEEENKKLNINGYIGRTIYDKNVTEQSLEVKLLRKDAYMDYEIYTFDVKNNSGDDIANLLVAINIPQGCMVDQNYLEQLKAPSTNNNHVSQLSTANKLPKYKSSSGKTIKTLNTGEQPQEL